MMNTITVPSPFSFEERDRRWGIARKIMQLNDLEVLMIYGDRESAAPAPFVLTTTLLMTA